MTYLARYQQGDSQAVWTDLVALGEAIHQEPLYTSAVEVAHELMNRARHNIALIVERLHLLNYRFAHSDRIWLPPDDRLVAKLDTIEQQYGYLPLVVRRWFEVVGQVRLMGAHPKLSCYHGLDFPGLKGPMGDPLVVAYYGVEHEEDAALSRSFFEFAPDACHKANTSGGGATSVEIPNAAFDGQLISEDQWDDMYFIPYLRTCFEWGGFPGLRDDSQAAAAARKELAFLTKDLLPI